MNITFGNKVINCRAVPNTLPSKFKLDDIILLKGGTPVKVVTVQRDCPVWESNRACKTVVIFQDADGQLIPINGISGFYTVMRKK